MKVPYTKLPIRTWARDQYGLYWYRIDERFTISTVRDGYIYLHDNPQPVTRDLLFSPLVLPLTIAARPLKT